MQHTTGKSISSRHTTQSAVDIQPEKVSAVDMQGILLSFCQREPAFSHERQL